MNAAPARAASARNDRVALVWAAAVSVALFAVYAANVCRTVAAGDSGLLATAMARWGVPHAPGYPLLALLGNLVVHAAGGVEPAFALDLLNAAFAAAACGVLALAVAVLAGRSLAGVVVALALGLSPTWWSLALAVEVFPLNSLFAALLLLAFAHVLRGARAGAPPLMALPVAAALAAAVLTHHTTLVLLVAPLALGFAVAYARVPPARLRPALAWSALAFVLALLPLLYIPLAARGEPPLSWGDARDLPSVVHLLLRRDFGTGTLVAPDIAAQAVLDHGVSASPLGLRHLRHFVTDLPARQGWGFALLALGGVALALADGWALRVLVIGFAATVFAFFTRVNTPWVPMFVGVTERLFVLPDLVLAFVAGLALARASDVAAKRWRFAPALVAIAALLACAAGRDLRPHALPNERDNVFTRELGTNLLAGLPQHAILFTDGDLFRNAALYQQACLGARPDVSVIDARMLVQPWYVRQLQHRHMLALPDGMSAYTGAPGADTRAILDANMRGPNARPVAGLRLMDGSWSAAYRMIPMGLWMQVVPRGTGIDPNEWAARFEASLRAWSVRSLAREYPPTSWEREQEVFYDWAIGSLRGAIELAAVVHPEAPPPAAVPALAAADHWSAARRADVTAYQADLLRSALVDSLVALTPQQHDHVALLAFERAKESLAGDPRNVQALQVAAWAEENPSFGVVTAAAALRARILAERPGDATELGAYLRAATLAARAGGVDSDALARADAARARFVATVNVARSVFASPDLERLASAWAAPLEGWDDARLAALAR